MELGSMSKITRNDLVRLGYTETSPGVWTRHNMGAMAGPISQPHAGNGAQSPAPGEAPSKGGVGKGKRRTRPTRRPVHVTLISVRKRPLDDDNLTAGMKPLRDCVAAWLGVDDGDPRVVWRVEQVQGKPEGTVVLVGVV